MKKQRKGNDQRRRLTARCLLVSVTAASLLGSWQDSIVYAASQQAAVSETGSQALADQENVSQTVEISTAEELNEFGKKCQSTVYSRNITAVLMADIDVSTVDFSPIPVFSGVLEGNGHKITGLDLQGPGSKCGLIRVLEAGSEVRNLTVEGSVLPGGAQELVGGIAGINKGTIRGCSFSGTIEGKKEIGGIAGSNEETGLIENCSSYGTVSGHTSTGGIAGVSEGTISGCVNESEVNIDAGLLTAAVDEDMSLNVEELENGITEDTIRDTGGIAGYSSGSILGCENRGKIGSEHLGANTGGIAGRQKGMVSGCTNKAVVLGSKNTAGIAGLFEPYAEEVYEQDALDKVSDQMDALGKLTDDWSDQLRGMSDKAVDHVERLDDMAAGLKDTLRENDNMRQAKREAFDEDASSQVNVIQDILDNTELDIISDSAKRSYGDIEEDLEEIHSIIDELIHRPLIPDMDDEEDFADAVEQDIQEELELIQRLKELTEDIASNSETMVMDGIGDAADGIESFRDDLNSLKIETNALVDMVGDYKDELIDDYDALHIRITDQLDAIYEEKDRMTDDLKADRDSSKVNQDQISQQMDEIGDTIEDGRQRVKDKADSLTEDDYRIFEDLSDQNIDVPGKGTILSCINEGTIKADYQAGGIAGMIGYENVKEEYQNPDTTGDTSLRVTRSARALLRGCKNTGEIQAQNNDAGGIVGTAKLGLILENASYADVESQKGDYAGGIVGSSSAQISGNYSKGTISGGDYVGGIAGYGKKVINNCAMVAVETASEDSEGGIPGEYHGSIVGTIEKEGLLQNNLYVDNGLGADDGITYENEAEGLPYEEFLQREGIPEEFRHLFVRFMADDTVIKEMECAYGALVPEEEIPQAPEKEGYYTIWEEEDLGQVLVDKTIHAVYRPYVTAIASSEEKMPMVLAEGIFYPDASITASEEPIGAEVADPEDYKAVKAIRYQVDFGKEEDGTQDQVRMRVYADGLSKHAAVGILNGTAIELADAKRSGEYLVFDAAAQGEIVLLEKRGVSMMFWGLLGAGAAAVVILIAYLLHRRKKHQLRKRFEKRLAEKKIRRENRKKALLENKQASSRQSDDSQEKGGDSK